VTEYAPEIANVPVATKTQLLVQMCEGFSARDKPTITHQESGVFEGWPARTVRYTFAGPNVQTPRIGETRAVMVGHRVFMVTYRGPQDRGDPADRAKFFDSFKLVAAEIAAAPGLATASAPTGRVERAPCKRFNSAAGGFSVLMPGEPVSAHEKDGLLGAAGAEIVTGDTDEAHFIVQYQDMPRAALKKGALAILKAARNSDEKVIQGKVVGEKSATIKGAAGGLSYQIDSPGTDAPMARVRTYLVGARLYQMIVVGPKPKFPMDESARFFQSFRLQTRN
jgi:hypothetical protein